MKTPIRRLDSLTHNDTAATKLINDNFEALQQGVEDALSRSGKKPNFMDDVLDMNMHRIINIADPVDDYDLANKHYVDTKVAEEETRAKAVEEALQRAIDDEEAARIAGDGSLRQLIDDEKTARQNADNAIIDSIGDATITFSQGGVVKGTISTNQKINATIDLDAGGSGIFLKNQTMTFPSGSGYARLDVSSFVEDGKAYCPFIFITSPEETIVSEAEYHVQNKAVDLIRNADYSYPVKTVNADICLIPVDTSETTVNGLSNGLYYSKYIFNSNLVTSLSSASTDEQYPSAKCVYDALQNAGGSLTPIILDQVWLENDSAEPVSDILVDLTNDYNVTYDANKSYIPIVVINTDEFAQYISYARVIKLSTGYQLDVHTAHNVTIPVGLNSNSSVILIPVDSVTGEIYYYGAVNNGNKVYQTKSNLVTSVSSSSTNAQYPSAKCVYDIVGNIETLLQSI